MVNQEDFKLPTGTSGSSSGNFLNGVHTYTDDCNDETQRRGA